MNAAYLEGTSPGALLCAQRWRPGQLAPRAPLVPPSGRKLLLSDGQGLAGSGVLVCGHVSRQMGTAGCLSS